MIYSVNGDYGVYFSRVVLRGRLRSFSFAITEKSGHLKILCFSGWSYCLFEFLCFLYFSLEHVIQSLLCWYNEHCLHDGWFSRVEGSVLYMRDREKIGKYKGAGWESGKQREWVAGGGVTLFTSNHIYILFVHYISLYIFTGWLMQGLENISFSRSSLLCSV